MLLAIDLGNTETRVGVWDGDKWPAIWRRPTSATWTADELANWLEAHLNEGLPAVGFAGAVIASVVPDATVAMTQAVTQVTECIPLHLAPDPRLGLEIRYNPPNSLGADRLANALAAKHRFNPPVLVVDIGTATTFEAVDRSGAFLGGAIMPGPALSAAALATFTAMLPEAALDLPSSPIGNSPLHALQSGIMLGHAAAIQGLAVQMVARLGEHVKVIATGGFGERFVDLCPVLQGYYPTLTLDGLVVAHGLLATGTVIT